MRLPPGALKALLLSALLSGGGCASLGPDTHVRQLSAIDVPDTWTRTALEGRQPGESRPTSLVSWWQRFGDEQLTRLIDLAVQSNTSVTAASAAVREARAQREAQAAQFWPRVDASLSAQRSDAGSGSVTELFDAGFDAAWEPDIFSATRSAVRGAAADLRSRIADLADVQISVAAEVAVTYIELRGGQARLAIARDNLASQLETLQLAEWRVQAGLATSLETEQARTSSEQTRAQIPALETTVSQARHALAVLTGQTPDALEQPLRESRAVPVPPDDLVLDIPADTLRQRPDVRSAEEQFGAALARLDQATANRMPGFSLSGSFGVRSATVDALGDSGAGVSSFIAGVLLPLFDAGALRAQQRSQQAVLDQARSSYEAAVLSALQEAEDALAALQGDRERLARLRAAAEAANNAWLLAQQRYSSGLIDFQVVLETQRTLLSTQDSVASTAADLSADHVRLYKALGGGWRPENLVDSPADRR